MKCLVHFGTIFAKKIGSLEDTLPNVPLWFTPVSVILATSCGPYRIGVATSCYVATWGLHARDRDNSTV